MSEAINDAPAIDDDARAGLAKIVRLILPGTASAPSGVDVGAHTELLDRAVAANPRLVRPVLDFGRRAGEVDDVTLDQLQSWSSEDCELVVFALSCAYYLSPEACAAVGYPGQQSRPIAKATAAERCSDELIEPVVSRGEIFVSTSGRLP